MENFVIAIDGGAATGKSTVAQLVAQKLNFKHINTGAIYRCITMLALEKKFDLNRDVIQIVELAQNIKINFTIENNLPQVYLYDHNVTAKLRNQEISLGASQIARHEKVRHEVLELQRDYARFNNIVMEGRDIGSVIFPNANLKIFFTASIDARAQRRFLEYQATNNNISLQDIKEEIILRDKQDTQRDISPLRKTDDAVEIDNTNMTKEDVVKEIVKLAREKMNYK